MTRSKGGTTKLGYQTHYVVDGGKARVILGVLVSPSEVTENRPMLDLLWRAVFRWHLRPQQVTGDARYGTRENVAAIEKAGIRAYVAIPNFDFRDTGLFGPGHFRYDAQGDHYVCPAGQVLRLQNEDRRNRRKRYRVSPKICNACELKAGCTTSEHGRVLYRPFDEDFYDRVRRYRGTEPYEKALRKRAVWVEPLFGEAKEWHGMRRFRFRRLEKVNTEALLIASGQNVKRLLAFGGRGPKKLTQVATLRPPTATGYKISRSREHHAERSWPPGGRFSTRWTVFETPLKVLESPVLLSDYANRSRVPTLLCTYASGNRREISWVAFHPVQCPGTNHLGPILASSSSVRGISGSKIPPVRCIPPTKACTRSSPVSR
jgi:Transposase DDE domain